MVSRFVNITYILSYLSLGFVMAVTSITSYSEDLHLEGCGLFLGLSISLCSLLSESKYMKVVRRNKSRIAYT
jgi:hypothetical protein